MSRKLTLAKEVALWAFGIESGKKKKTATNEVLSEINNAVCMALKDSSRGGVFLYGPAELWSKWVVGGVVRGYKASPAGRTVQTAAA